MYDTLRREYYWPNRSTDVCNTVQHCHGWHRMSTRFKHQRQLQPFPPSGLLESIAIGILGAYPRTKSGKQYIYIITDRYTKLTRAVLAANKLSTHVADIHSNHSVFPCQIPDFILSDEGQTFVSKHFISLCDCLDVKE